MPADVDLELSICESVRAGLSIRSDRLAECLDGDRVAAWIV